MNDNKSFGCFIGLGAILLMLFVLFAGLYFGIWTMLVGGIIQIVEACKLSPIPAAEVAFGVVKILLCEIPICISIVVDIFILGTLWGD